jgi:hypothetical protein
MFPHQSVDFQQFLGAQVIGRGHRDYWFQPEFRDTLGSRHVYVTPGFFPTIEEKPIRPNAKYCW